MRKNTSYRRKIGKFDYIKIVPEKTLQTREKFIMHATES